MNPAPSENILTYVLWALVAIVILCVTALVWVIKQRSTKEIVESGTLPEAQWILNITKIVQVENDQLEGRIKDALQQGALNDHEFLRGLIATAERNIIKELIKNGH